MVLNHCKFVGRNILHLSVFLFRAHVIKEVSLLCVSLQNTTGIENESGEFKVRIYTNTWPGCQRLWARGR